MIVYGVNSQHNNPTHCCYNALRKLIRCLNLPARQCASTACVSDSRATAAWNFEVHSSGM